MGDSTNYPFIRQPNLIDRSAKITGFYLASKLLYFIGKKGGEGIWGI